MNNLPVFDYEDITIDREADFDEFALCKCQKHIDDFRSTFIEFKNANFLVQKIEVEPMASRTVYIREVDPRRKI